MIRQDALVGKVRNRLEEFLLPLGPAVDRPRQRFLREVVRGILLSGSLVVSELAGWVHDHCSDRFYRLKRLLHHLVSHRGDLTGVVAAYRQWLLRYLRPHTLLLLDLIDLAKPRARRMEYLSYVRDGSAETLVPGYWCVEIYAALPGRHLLPLALDAFSVDDPTVGSMNLEIAREVKAVNAAVQGRGIYVADRGFDGLEMYDMWFSEKSRFLVRQRGDRLIITPEGTKVIMRDWLERLYQRQANSANPCGLVFAQVRLPTYPQEPLYVVARWLKGCDTPLMLLTNMVVAKSPQARQVLGWYRQRWACEEAVQFLKSRVGLERFRIRRYVAIQRLCILAMLAMGFLTWLLLQDRQTIRRLLAHTSRFRKNCRFQYYRLLDGLQTLARANPTPWRQPLNMPP